MQQGGGVDRGIGRKIGNQKDILCLAAQRHNECLEAGCQIKNISDRN
jgi:hypothetical protein